jgi:hypothetical protein
LYFSQNITVIKLGTSWIEYQHARKEREMHMQMQFQYTKLQRRSYLEDLDEEGTKILKLISRKAGSYLLHAGWAWFILGP